MRVDLSVTRRQELIMQGQSQFQYKVYPEYGHEVIVFDVFRVSLSHHLRDGIEWIRKTADHEQRDAVEAAHFVGAFGERHGLLLHRPDVRDPPGASGRRSVTGEHPPRFSFLSPWSAESEPNQAHAHRCAQTERAILQECRLDRRHPLLGTFAAVTWSAPATTGLQVRNR